ncbi:hypothetical protein D3C71_1719080 [compost metagenome]
MALSHPGYRQQRTESNQQATEYPVYAFTQAQQSRIDARRGKQQRNGAEPQDMGQGDKQAVTDLHRQRRLWINHLHKQADDKNGGFRVQRIG